LTACATSSIRGWRPLEHKAFKSDLPGRVDLWDWIEKAEKEDDKPWYDPVDTVGENHHSVLLANRIADHILRQTQCGQITQIIREDGARPDGATGLSGNPAK